MHVLRTPTLTRALLIGFASTITMLVMIGGEFFSSTRQRAHQLLFTRAEESENIVIVAIDDPSLQAYGRSPTEWTRARYVPVIEALSGAGARVIGIDLLMPETASGDAELSQAIADARSSDLRTRFVVAASAGGSVRPITLADGSTGARYQARLSPVKPLADVVDYIGFSNALSDVSGIQCCQLSYVLVDDHIGLSFSLATYLAYLRIPSGAVQQVVYTEADQLFVTPERGLYVDAFGQWIQNFNAPVGHGFRVISFAEIAEGRADLSEIQDKIVLIGLMNASGAVDTYRVPILSSNEMSGVEIHANAIETLLQNNPLRELNRLELLVLMAGMALGSALIYEHLRWYLRPVAYLIVLVGMIAAAMYLYSQQQILFPLFDGALAMGLPLGAGLAVFTWREARQREQAEFTAKIAEHENTLLKDVILGSPTPTVVLDQKLGILSLNRSFARLLDVTLDGTETHALLTILENDGLEETFLDNLRAGFAKRADFQTELTHKGFTYQCAANWLPRLNRWVLSWADVTILAEMNEVKRHMLLMVSHDLRNPLSSVFLHLHQAKRYAANVDPKLKKSVESAEASARTMQFILTDVIDLEQIRSVAFPLSVVDLTAVCGKILERYRDDLELKQLQTTLSIDTEYAKINANEGQITQMLANLVSNAIKFTPKGGNITVVVENAPYNRLRVRVVDTGVGIPKEAQGKLFTEFYRVKTRATSEIPGTGLGLSLVKTIVKKHGGQVWLESEEGIGTTVYVEFPVATEETNL